MGRKFLRRTLKSIDRPVTFVATGSAPMMLPGMEVEGAGPISLPLPKSQEKKLIRIAEQAPYGKGEETLVDINVRRVWEIDAAKVSFANEEWIDLLAWTIIQVKEQLGLLDCRINS